MRQSFLSPAIAGRSLNLPLYPDDPSGDADPPGYIARLMDALTEAGVAAADRAPPKRATMGGRTGPQGRGAVAAPDRLRAPS